MGAGDVIYYSSQSDSGPRRGTGGTGAAAEAERGRADAQRALGGTVTGRDGQRTRYVFISVYIFYIFGEQLLPLTFLKLQMFTLETLLSTDMHRRLHQIHSSVDDHSNQMKELQARSAHLEQDIQLRAQRQRSRTGTQQPEEALRPLKQELHHRLHQGEDLDATLSETQRELQAAEESLQVLLLHHLILGPVTPEIITATFPTSDQSVDSWRRMCSIDQ